MSTTNAAATKSALIAWVQRQETAGKAVRGMAAEIERQLSMREAAPGTLVYHLSQEAHPEARMLLNEALAAVKF